MAKRIQIFRVGTHTAMDGKSYDFTEQMLRDAVTAYNPSVFEAQLVIGHPKTNDPSYGGAKSLYFVEDTQTVEMEPCNVEPAFAELVNAGRFKKPSASWYLPDAPENPVPGSLYLRHVGFLGAQPPALKGLKHASFSDSGVGVAEFADWSDVQVAAIFRRIREFFISKFSMEDADSVIPDYALQSLEQLARAESAAESNSISYAEHSEQDAMTPEQIKAAQEKLAADQAALQAAQQRLQADQASFAERESAQAKAARHQENAVFIDGLVTEGKLLPAHKDGMVAFMDGLASDGVVEFGEGDKVTKTPSIDFLKDFLSKQQKLVEFGERNTGAEPVDVGDAEALADKASAYRNEQLQAGKSVSFAEAVAHITKSAQQ